MSKAPRVFLSHSGDDKPAVLELGRRLREAGFEPWIDHWNLTPGEPWQEELESALRTCDVCLVFIGPGGFGPWQNKEMRAAINRRVELGKETMRVIPVLLPGAERGDRSRLPAFLQDATWVEFRHTLDDGEAFGRLVSGIKGLPPGPYWQGPVPVDQNPYRGLAVFDVEHAPFFFGREALTGWLLDKLRPAKSPGASSRFLAIVGASGSGKSSLARAGLVAALNNGAIDGSASWPVVICRPGPNPLESLAVAFSKPIAIGTEPAAVSNLIDLFKKNESAVHLTTRLALQSEPPAGRFVVLVDQFEEVFTVCTDDDLRRAFIDNLLFASKEGSRSHPESGCILNRLPRNPRYFSVNSWMIVNISYDRYLSSRTVVDFGSCKVFSMVFV